MTHEPVQQAQACIIWMHGLGADAQDMMGLAHALRLSYPVRHVSLQAPLRAVTVNGHMMMPAWYDILGVRLTDREDREGILASEAMVREAIEAQVQSGLKTHQIFLAGFSQGGAMALFTGLRSTYALGGLIALSAYVPMASACEIHLSPETPVFMALGTSDPIVLPSWTQQGADLLTKQGFSKLSVHAYPMEHSVCAEEMTDLAFWLTRQFEDARSSV